MRSGRQRRHGINRGGLYYLFEWHELDLVLLRNAGETELGDDEQAPFYVELGDREGSGEGLESAAAELALMLGAIGISTRPWE